MVNVWVRCLILAAVGLSSLNISGQTNRGRTAIDLIEIQEDTAGERLKEAIEKTIKGAIDMKWVASQNKVLEVECKDKQVIVNLVGDIIGYGGGTQMEYLIGALVMKAVFENSKADVVTILVDGQADRFPEGSDYSYCTRADYELYYQLDNGDLD